MANILWRKEWKKITRTTRYHFYFKTHAYEHVHIVTPNTSLQTTADSFHFQNTNCTQLNKETNTVWLV